MAPEAVIVASGVVRVCGFLINGANADYTRFQRDLRRASTIFGPCGIRVVEGRFQVINDPTLLDHPRWACRGRLPYSARRMVGLGSTCGVGDVVMFYIRSMGSRSAGCGGIHFANNRGFVATDFASRNTFAHELGHALGLVAHALDSDNIMFTPSADITADPPQVTSAQCQIINRQLTVAPV